MIGLTNYIHYTCSKNEKMKEALQGQQDYVERRAYTIQVEYSTNN
jgi:hypothetical protein